MRVTPVGEFQEPCRGFDGNTKKLEKDRAHTTGVPRSYKNAAPYDPTVGLRLSYERGTPAPF